MEHGAFVLSNAGLWVLAVFQALVTIELGRRVVNLEAGGGGRASAIPTEFLQTGTLAPHFRAKRVQGGGTLDSKAFAGSPATLFFVSPSCSSCITSAPYIVSTNARGGGRAAVICHGDQVGCSEFAATYVPGVEALHDGSGEISRAFHVRQTPVAVQLDEHWRVLRYGMPREEALAQIAAAGTKLAAAGSRQGADQQLLSSAVARAE